MLDRVDRMLLAVHDTAAAASTFEKMLGAQKVREDRIEHPYNAKRLVVQAGDSEFELLEPAGEGPLSQHLERWGQGIFAAGFSTPDLARLAKHLEDNGVHFTQQGSQLFIEPDQTRGMRTVIQASEKRDRVGRITGLYETTNIVTDHNEAAGYYARIFGLDQSRFQPIKSPHFRYTGTLTLFDPPAKLDRIEITETVDERGAMGRFFLKRGPSIYMCFVEAPDLGAVKAGLDAAEARYAQAVDFPDASVFIHPTSLCGMLMGISATDEAWRWSGRSDLAPSHA